MNQDIEFIPMEDDNDTQSSTSTFNTTSVRRQVNLDGTKTLDFYFAEKEYHFPFKKISLQELEKLRTNQKYFNKLKREKKSLLVLKHYGLYFITQIPAKLSLTSQTIGTHLCAKCNRCYASLDAKGGCAKVRDQCISVYLREGKSLEMAIQKSKRLEKYPFIDFGLEIINTVPDSFVVLDCKRFVNDVINPNRLYGTQLLRMKYELQLHVQPELSWEAFLASHHGAFAQANKTAQVLTKLL